MAGRMRLAVTGIQDQWLTGEPQFSYFVMQYKRHTRFATEAVEKPFDGKVAFGQTVTCRIPNNIGDLVRSMMLKVTLEPLTGSNKYNTSIGSRMIDHVDLKIGGQTIERLTGEYIYMYDQLHNNIDDTEQTLYFLTGHNNHLVFRSPYTFYVNIPFYFFRHPSLAIPVCAITKQLVEVEVTFLPATDTISYTYGESRTPSSDGVIASASLITDFYFITDDEKNFLLTRPIEYVITQLQMARIPFKPNTSERSVMLQFKHPVKEMFFIATLHAPDLIPTDDSMLFLSSEIPARSDVRHIKRISLECNGATVFDHSGTQLAYQQSLDHHTGCPSPAYEFYMYSFALKPEVYYPTGQVNMSRIIHQKLNVELAEVDASNEIIVHAYASNYNVLRIESGLAGLKF